MAALTGVRVLADATSLVERGWTQAADARGADGSPLDPWDERAVCWSTLGAIVAVLEREARSAGEVPLEELAAALYAIADVVPVDSLEAWNDAPQRTQDEVVRMLHAASAAYEPLD